MKCAVCGATCVCKNARGGMCCGCHRHKGQLRMTRVELDTWRRDHHLEPVSHAQWLKQYEEPRARQRQTTLFRDEADAHHDPPR